MKAGDSSVLLRTLWVLLGIFVVLQVLFLVVGVVPRTPFFVFHIVASWAFMLALAFLATRRIGRLSTTIEVKDDASREMQGKIEQLQTQNAILQIIARTVDVPLAFQELALRIARLVPCDRVGLALLNEAADEFQTYTARVQDEERRARPRPEIVFKADRTAIGHVVRTREPLLVNNTAEGATDYIDANVLHTSGFGSALVVPLVSRGRAVGTLNVVARKTDAFGEQHIRMLLPIAELFAVAYVAQQLQVAVAKHRAVETMTELTLGVSSDINGALQVIIGHCDLLERGYPDSNLQRDLAVVVRQAQRILSLLEKMRSISHERLRVAAETAKEGMSSTPEASG